MQGRYRDHACVEVAAITNDPKDTEVWQFEARVPTGYGGRMPVDHGIVGSKDQSETG